MNIWLDDVRPPPDDTWLWAKTYNEAVFFICLSGSAWEPSLSRISFDHDLGEAKTGYDVAKFLAEMVEEGRVLKPRTATVHSANPPGRDNIQSVIDRYLK